MIIVKTKNGDHFINDKAVIKVEHNKERAIVTCYADKGIYSYMENVEQVVYINDAQPTEWKDEGSEIERMKAELEKKKKELSQFCEHFGFVREWYMIYKQAIDRINDMCNDLERNDKNIIVNPKAIVDKAIKDVTESMGRFEQARAKWEVL